MSSAEGLEQMQQLGFHRLVELEYLTAGGRRDDQAQGVDLGDGAGLADVAPAPLRGAVGVNGEAEQVVGHAPLVGLPQLGDHLAGGL